MTYIPTTTTEYFHENGGYYEVRVGDQTGWVTSHHLIGTKEKQLQTAWLVAHPEHEEAE